MRKLYLFMLVFTTVSQIWGQELSVSKLEERDRDLLARTDPRADRNGNPCALVKVIIPILEGVTFEGWVIDTEYVPGEYRVYVPEGTKKILLRHPNFLPKEIVFDRPVLGKHTYQIIVSLPVSTNNNILVHLTTNVKKAKLTINEMTFETDNGEFNLSLPKGTYNYSLSTETTGFKMRSGSFVLNGNQAVENLPRIDLETDVNRILTLRYEKNTQIKVDGTIVKKLKNDQLTLPAGIHEIEASIGDQNIWFKRFQIDLSDQDQTVDLSLRGSFRITYPANAQFTIKPQPGALKPNKSSINSGETVFLLGDYSVEVKKKGYAKALSYISIGVNSNVDNYRIEVKNKGDDYMQGVNGKPKDMEKAYKQYKKLADGGDDIAQYAVAQCLSNGWGVIRNESMAITYLKQSAEQQNPDAIIALAELSTGVLKYDYTLKAANLGNAVAQVNLAEMYMNGENTRQDYQEALIWYQRAAATHQNKAYFALGEMYGQGLGVEKNTVLAKNYYERAAFEGHEKAIERLADLDYDNKQIDNAISSYLKLSSPSNRTLLRLGYYYYSLKDIQKAIFYFAQAHLASLQDEPLGKAFADIADQLYEHNRTDAISFYEKAIGLGFKYVTAYRRIGINNLNTDKMKAFKYLEKAMQLNDPEGTCYFGYCFEAGVGTGSNAIEAGKLYMRAVQLGYLKAYRFLGTLYKNGKGVPQNDEKAVECWEKAANAGSKEAVKNLIKYYQYVKNYSKMNQWKSRL